MVKKKSLGVHCFFLCAVFLLGGAVLAVTTGKRILKEARNIEAQNKDITYSYDAINASSEKIVSVPLFSECIPAADVIRTDDNSYLVSFDKTYFGTVELRFPVPLQDEQHIKITLSETCSKDGAWTRTNMSRALEGFGISYYNDSFVIPKDATIYRVQLPERPLPKKDYIKDESYKGGVVPFCYCQIEEWKGEILDRNCFFQVAVHTSFDDSASDFSCDVPLLNEIYHLCKDTIKATTYAGVYVDGYRELQPYEADSYINMLSHFSVDTDYEVAKNTLEYFADNHTWPTEWILQTILLAYEYYMYSGDVGTIERIFPALQKCLLADMKNENGLIDSRLYGNNMRDIVDWPEVERDGFSSNGRVSTKDIFKAMGYAYRALVARLFGFRYAAVLWKITGEGVRTGNVRIASPNAVVNAFYYRCLECLSFLAGEIGKREEQSRYADETVKFKKLYCDTFVSPKTGLVFDAVGSAHASLHANMFALDFGLIPKEQERTVLKYIKKKGMACSVYGAQFLLDSLCSYNEDEYALKLMLSKKRKSWYEMLYRTKSKLTTEAWNERIKPNMDWNHAWGTAPVNIIARNIVGVRPYAPGGAELLFEPKFGSLKECMAKVPFRMGGINILYKRNGNTCSLSFTSAVPVHFCIPKDVVSVSADGEMFSMDEREIVLPAGNHTFLMAVTLN